VSTIQTTDGVSVFVEDTGEGATVVLISGFGMDHTLWRGSAAALRRAGLRVLAVDLRGHGSSAKPLSGYDIDTLARDIRDVLSSSGISPVVIVGHSFGGQVALALAADSPNLVQALVLVGSNGVRASRSDDFPFGAPLEVVLPAALAAERDDREGARRASIANSFAHPPTPELLESLVAVSLRMPSHAALACYESMFTADLIDRMPAVRQPVLQIIGAADPAHSARGARWLRENLVNSTLVELPDCGHFPMLEQPTLFEAVLGEFIASQLADL
jgi:pimeloyl-ACP methyl ester carboxylesterase